MTESAQATTDGGLGPLIGVARKRTGPLLVGGAVLAVALACVLWWAGGRRGAHPGSRAASVMLLAMTGILIGMHIIGRCQVHEHGLVGAGGTRAGGSGGVLLFADLRAIREETRGKTRQWIFVDRHGAMRALDQGWLMDDAVRRRIEAERARLAAGGQT